MKNLKLYTKPLAVIVECETETIMDVSSYDYMYIDEDAVDGETEEDDGRYTQSFRVTLWDR